MKTDFKVLQLLNGLRGKGFQALNNDQAGTISSLSHVQNFLDDEGGYRPISNPRNSRGHIPLLATPCVTFQLGAAPKK
jgi:hypothetical protein